MSIKFLSYRPCNSAELGSTVINPSPTCSSFFLPSPPITKQPSSSTSSYLHEFDIAPMAASPLLFSALSILIPIPIIFVFFFFFFTRSKSSSSKKLKIPPGPPGWPIVGNLFQVALSKKPFIRYVRELIPLYGPMFTLRMGARTLIIISSAELAHEALIEKGQLFASRPAENPTRVIFSCNKFTVNSAIYGPEWRSLRRNMVSGMLSSARLKQFYPNRAAAMDRFIDRIRSEAIANDGAILVLRNARYAVFCILISMCFGVELDEKEIIRTDEVMKRVLITLSPRIDDDYLPLLRPFFSKQRAQALSVRQEQIDTIVPLIDKRRAILQNPNDHKSAAPFSYLDSLLDLLVEGRKSPPNDTELVTLCSEFLNFGTDTTATAIEWGIARLINNPSIQSKLYQEIISVSGAEKPVTENDIEGMVYLQAFVKELLRKHPPTYFSLTHAAVQTAKLGGYDVPADANLEIYLPTISEDPRLWKEPQEFKPERFLPEGGEIADITGVKEIKMIPFGAGRRICPGLGMGTIHISLMLARMVQAFEWKLHPDEPQLEFESKLEFSVVMSRPLLALVKERKY